MANPVFSARGGGGFGKFEPFLGRVQSCNQNCKVFLADYTCFIFKFVVFKGKEFTFTELMALKKRSTRNSWSITLHFTKVLLSNLALGWGIWTQFWPEGVGGSRNLMFKWPGGCPRGILKLQIDWCINSWCWFEHYTTVCCRLQICPLHDSVSCLIELKVYLCKKQGSEGKKGIMAFVKCPNLRPLAFKFTIWQSLWSQEN